MHIMSDYNVPLQLPIDWDWGLFPKGTYELLARSVEIRGQRDLDEVIAFVVQSSQLFVEDREYTWNFSRTRWAAYLLAVELLRHGRARETRCMVFYVAFLNECMARGHNVVQDRFVRICENAGNLQNTQCHRLAIKLVFSKFAFMNEAVNHTKSLDAMTSFLSSMIDKYCSNLEAQSYRPEEYAYNDSSLRPLNIYRTIPEATKAINVTCNGTIFFEVEVYDDTTLKWVFNKIVAGTFYDRFKLLNGKGNINLKDHPCLCLRKIGSANMPSDVWYLATSGSKTIHDIGLADGDNVEICQLIEIQVISSNIHQPTRIKKKPNRKRSKSKRAVVDQVSSSSQEPDLDTLREVHSISMAPVFHELVPKLKVIREKINALSLKKERPKDRRVKRVGGGKGTDTVSTTMDYIPKEDSLVGKAGKAVYPVLVGEASNLYKTRAILVSRKAFHMDLHGCSRHEAMIMLSKGLDTWVQDAMKGEYPFVIPVDIICGKGNQSLSEVVAQFIRDSPHVANRPKRAHS